MLVAAYVCITASVLLGASIIVYAALVRKGFIRL
jgi:hypothetical protein